MSLGFAVVGGDRGSYQGTNVYGGTGGHSPSIEGKSYGILALADTLYAWVSPGSDATNYTRASLLRSADGARSWDSTGVTFEGRRDGVILPAMLNFGPGYRGARDNYVYHYFVDLVDGADLVIQRPGRVSLARSPVGELDRHSAYEWFAGFDSASAPVWEPTVARRVPVFEDPNGVGWNLSVSRNPGLGRYLLATEHGETGASNLGVFEAPEPWGPWRTVHYQSGWGEDAIERSVFYWNFANRWLSEDGLEFVLVFSGFGENDSWNSIEGRFVTGAAVPPDP